MAATIEERKEGAEASEAAIRTVEYRNRLAYRTRHTVRVNPRERPNERRRYNRIARLVCHHDSLSLGFTLLA